MNLTRKITVEVWGTKISGKDRNIYYYFRVKHIIAFLQAVWDMESKALPDC